MKITRKYETFEPTIKGLKITQNYKGDISTAFITWTNLFNALRKEDYLDWKEQPNDHNNP